MGSEPSGRAAHAAASEDFEGAAAAGEDSNGAAATAGEEAAAVHFAIDLPVLDTSRRGSRGGGSVSDSVSDSDSEDGSVEFAERVHDAAQVGHPKP